MFNDFAMYELAKLRQDEMLAQAAEARRAPKGLPVLQRVAISLRRLGTTLAAILL